MDENSMIHFVGPAQISFRPSDFEKRGRWVSDANGMERFQENSDGGWRHVDAINVSLEPMELFPGDAEALFAARERGIAPVIPSPAKQRHER